ncbi:efflux RND transporter periplasmic adaptor subunit [Rubinisphaera margarita]|uniref:efflux RND transporter periplasmic adaptor subunit n=1 Tax=Rubinisphaera margarita TaxID=2909586 RepID=UPI001EE78CAA|nr:HlyD family efflux transporter periplasmic adaptor subunit [Rubinisphaera margarita]MCG6158260.1 HlyD family efflux transporter periplasmic adaptor subunit [Rubinisphaera margarita]
MTSLRKSLQEVLRFALPFVILGIGVVGFAALQSQREQPVSVPVETSRPLVDTVPVQVASEGLDVDLNGMVVPFREIQLSAEVAGRVTRKSPECRAGHYVHAGTPLLTIDERSYQLAVERLQEELAQAENSLVELDVKIANFDASISLLEEDVQLKQDELQRARQVHSRGGLNESELNDFRANELATRNTLVSMQNEKRISEASRERLSNARDLAQAKLREAELDLEKAQIVAPIDGVIVSEDVEEGNFVAAGTKLVTIDDTSAAEVRTTLRMEELNWILRHDASLGHLQEGGQQNDYQLPQVPATISYRLGTQTYQWQGFLSRYEGIGLNEQTRTVPVRLLVPEPQNVQRVSSARVGGPRALVRGMFVDVTLHVQPNVGFLEIPERAVHPGNKVWVVRNQLLQEIELTRVNFEEGKLLVPDGETDLRAGDSVVVSPLLAAREGLSVQSRDSGSSVADNGSSEEGSRN